MTNGSKSISCASAGDEVKESIRWIEGLETAAELSAACGEGTRVISVCDREGDVWSLFERAHQHRDQVGLLVRSNASRQRKVIDEEGGIEDLRASVEGLPKVAVRRLNIEAQGGKRARKKRVAKVSLRIAEVQVKAPSSRTDSLPLIAVSVLEERPPASVKEQLNCFFAMHRRRGRCGQCGSNLPVV